MCIGCVWCTRCENVIRVSIHSISLPPPSHQFSHLPPFSPPAPLSSPIPAPSSHGGASGVAGQKPAHVGKHPKERHARSDGLPTLGESALAVLVEMESLQFVGCSWFIGLIGLVSDSPEIKVPKKTDHVCIPAHSLSPLDHT